MSFLFPYQKNALVKMHNGCILNGGVGSGKSRVSLYYYFTVVCGGKIDDNLYEKMQTPINLYIITTAKKRDGLEWEEEFAPFRFGLYSDLKVVVDSWNNIEKYIGVSNSFFIFDEQRVVGRGAWVKHFLKISRNNLWILLSATPGDTWSDYIPVFIANGFYRNRTEFNEEHVVWSRFAKYPKVDKYLDVTRLVRLRNRILVSMDFERKTVRHNEVIRVNYDKKLYYDVLKTRWDPYLNKPFKNAADLCTCLRKICNEDEDRQLAILQIFEDHPKLIIFYSFDYELEILKSLGYGPDVEIAEWNGHKHQPIPDSKKWVYLVQYTSGAEGWNCIVTDTIIFYSQTYSYRILEQCRGRIDRLNTPYTDLWYYHLRSSSPIDIAISKALDNKKKFNECKFVGGSYFD